MTDFMQRPAESPLSWLARLAAMDAESLTPDQRRVRAACMAEARRLSQEERQRAKWGHGRG